MSDFYNDRMEFFRETGAKQAPSAGEGDAGNGGNEEIFDRGLLQDNSAADTAETFLGKAFMQRTMISGIQKSQENRQIGFLRRSFWKKLRSYSLREDFQETLHRFLKRRSWNRASKKMDGLTKIREVNGERRRLLKTPGRDPSQKEKRSGVPQILQRLLHRQKLQTPVSRRRQRMP